MGWRRRGVTGSELNESPSRLGMTVFAHPHQVVGCGSKNRSARHMRDILIRDVSHDCDDPEFSGSRVGLNIVC